jgi:hypothetical protein
VLGKISDGFPLALRKIVRRVRAGASGRWPSLIKERLVSYSMQEPEWPLVCECWYDELHDSMERGDCCLHCDMEEEIAPLQECQPPEPETEPKKPAMVVKTGSGVAA